MTLNVLSAALRRHGALLLATLVPLAALLLMAPIPQDPAYHLFADQRAWFGVPNFSDVVSSVPLIVVGAWGLRICLARPVQGTSVGWLVFFAGITLVGAGSVYYHWAPGSDTLVWDRLPLTLVYTGFFIALVSEWISARLASLLVVPIVLAGLGSIVYWHYLDDLRMYAWVQLLPFLTIPVVMLFYRARHTHQHYLLIVLAIYVLARISEIFDREIFALSGHLVSGHTLKHILAALAACVVLLMLKARTPIPAR